MLEKRLFPGWEIRPKFFAKLFFPNAVCTEEGGAEMQRGK